MYYANYYGGGGGWPLGKGNEKCRFQSEKNKKGEYCIKYGVNGFKITTFWFIYSKIYTPSIANPGITSIPVNVVESL